MHNIIFGLITIVICCVFYFISWKSFKKENYTSAILFIILSGFLFFFFSASDLYLHAWDERYHALVAKNLISHPFIPTLYDNPLLPYDYREWIENHIWVHKQPLPLWLMAGSMKLFGVNEIALRLPSVLMSSIGVLLTYKIGRHFYNQKIGLLAGFFFSVNGLILELTGGRIATDHIDVVFLFFILLAIFLTTQFIERKHIIFTILIGISVGAAILTKWLPAIIVLPIWLLLVINSKSFSIKAIVGHFLLLLLTIVLIALPWQLYINAVFPKEAAHEASYNLRHFTEVLGKQSGSAFYFLEQIRINYGELLYLPLIWFVWRVLQKPFNLKQSALFIWFIVPLIIFSIATTKMQGYLLFTAPAYFIITSAFFFELVEYKTSQKAKWLFNIILGLFLILPLRYGIERMELIKKRDRNPQWTLDLKKLNERSIKKGVLFNYNNPIEAMFYTDLTAYSTLPSNQQIKVLMNDGYCIFINDNGDLGDFQKLDGVEILKLSPSK